MLNQTPKIQTQSQLKQPKLQFQQTTDINKLAEILKYKQEHNSCYFITNKDIVDNKDNFMIYKDATMLFANIDINTSDTDFTFYIIYRTKNNEELEEGLALFNTNEILKLLLNGSLTALYTSNNKPDNEINSIINGKE